ncbi:MAG: hypothetical protein M3P32_02935 [Chloroflexota bacterium]|nr:hypothetical protein [Chloroflexota bacterium]
MRKIATLLVALGLTLGLLGAGISATFTDSATGTTTVSVGTFNIDLSSSTPGAVVTGGNISLTFPTIQSSAAGSAPLVFTVTSTGSIPALIHVTATTPVAPFTDRLGSVADFTLTQGQTHVFDAGLSWPELFNGDLGTSAAVTYTVSATQ